MATEVREDRQSQGVLRDARVGRQGRGAHLNYYDELGFSSTEEGRNTIMAGEEAFQGRVTESRGQIAEAQGVLDTDRTNVQSSYDEQHNNLKATYESTLNKIPSANEIVRDAWNNSGNVVVQMVSNDGKSVEGTYILPKQSVDLLDQKTSELGMYGTYLPDQPNYYNIAGGGHELRAELESGAETYKNNFYADALPKAQNAYTEAKSSLDSQFASALGDLQAQMAEANLLLSESENEIISATADVDSSVASREAEWTAMRDDYQNKLDTMRGIYGNFNVKEGY